MGLRALGGFALVVRDRWAIVGLPFSQGDHVEPKPGVRGKDPVVAMAMDTWRRDESGETLEELEGREQQEGSTVGRGSG